MSDAPRPTNTPEGHTPEDPAPSELGKLGTPGAGMTPAVPHPADAESVEAGREAFDPGGRAAAVHPDAAHPDAAHAAAEHSEAHATTDDDHGHAEPRVGPVDWTAWGYAAVGIAAGLLVVALFYVATL